MIFKPPVDVSYSLHEEFGAQSSSEGRTDNGASQSTPAPSFVGSADLGIDPQDWQVLLLQKIEVLTVRINSELQEVQNLYDQLEIARTQQNVPISFTATTAHPVSFATTTPFHISNIPPHSFNQSPASQGGTCQDIPPRMPTPPTSQPSIATYAQRPTHPPSKDTVRNRTGKVFRCECGHKTSRKGDMARHRESLIHTDRNYACYCGKRYTRKDAWLRHMKTHKASGHVFADDIY